VGVGVPLAQRRIQASCVHPSGVFTEFEKAALERSVPERFEQIVARYPDRIAIKTATHALTYAELNRRANRVARAILARRGTTTETVALYIDERSVMVTAMLAALKAGKIYVPIDPSFPKPRVTFMLQDSNARLVVTDNDTVAVVDGLSKGCDVLNVDALDPALPTDDVGVPAGPATLAYIIYTSGSTGQPKGVVQNHRNVLHRMMAATNMYHLSVEDRFALLYSCSFSASALPVFGALLNGAILCPFDVPKRGVAGLARWLRQEAVTAYFSGPTLFRSLVETLTGPDDIPDIRLLYLATESSTKRDVALYKKYFAPHCILIHMFSSGETGAVRQYFIDKDTEIEGSALPAGYEIPDKELLLLDENGRPVAVDEVGEIAVRSRYVSVGYWQRPDLTEAKFSSSPENPDERTYRTGDLGRMLPDGCLYHMGRKDFQVKARGFKVEVAEIETALKNLDGVKDAVVLPKQDVAGNTRLVAYVVPSGPPPTISGLRRTLAEQLPSYMVPSAFLLLDAMPLTPTGKVDRRTLPDPGNTRPALDTPFIAPRTPLESRLAPIWADVLGLAQVGVHDNFFDLGGHSLTAAAVVSRVVKELQLELPLASLLRAPTVAEMALVIVRGESHHQPATQPYWITLQSGLGTRSVFCVPYIGGFRADLARFSQLGRLVGPDYAFYGLQARGTTGVLRAHRHVGVMLAEYIRAMRSIQPRGPYFLLGECFSGRLAYAIAQELRAQGDDVAFLGLLDLRNPETSLRRYLWRRVTARVRYRYDRIADAGGWAYLRARAAFHLSELRRSDYRQRLRHGFALTASVLRMLGVPVPSRNPASGAATDRHGPHGKTSTDLARAERLYWLALTRYRPRPYRGRITVFVNAAWYAADPTLGWPKLAVGGLDVRGIPGDHTTYVTEHLDVLGRELRHCLDRAGAEAPA